MQKNSNWLIAGILFVGAVIGILFVAVFTSVIHWAGTNEFCGTFCHDMTRVYAAYHRGSHGRSPSGMTAGCSDCHLKYHSNEHIGPIDYSLMLVDKCFSASSSAWGWVRGTMNTDEKQITIAPELSKKVHEHMIKQDFSTCRGCHDFSKMYDPKKPFVAQIHKNMTPGKKVDCLACHPNVGHVYQPGK